MYITASPQADSIGAMLTIRDAMSILNLSRASVYRAMADRRNPLKVCHFGRAVRIPMAEIQRYVRDKLDECA